MQTDKETIPPKLTRIERLMQNLEELSKDGCSLSPKDTARDARQLILDLLGLSNKPEGEALYANYCAVIKSDEDPREALKTAVMFLNKWLPDSLPASADGKVHFARALAESLAEAAERYMKTKGDWS